MRRFTIRDPETLAALDRVHRARGGAGYPIATLRALVREADPDATPPAPEPDRGAALAALLDAWENVCAGASRAELGARMALLLTPEEGRAGIMTAAGEATGLVALRGPYDLGRALARLRGRRDGRGRSIAGRTGAGGLTLWRVEGPSAPP